MKLGPSDVLKLTFQVAEAEGGKGVQPHQTFLRFSDEATGEEGVQPVRVTPGGKAKFELVRIPLHPLACARVLTDVPSRLPTEHGAPTRISPADDDEPTESVTHSWLLRARACSV